MNLLRALVDSTSGELHVPLWLWASIVVGHGLALAVLIRALRACRRATRIRQALMDHDWSAVPEGARPSRLLALGAVIGPLLILGATLFALHRFRGLIVQGIGPSALDRKSELFCLGLQGELTATIAGALGLVLPLLLGAVAAGLAESARRRSRGLLKAAVLARRDPLAAQAWATFPGPSATVLVAVCLAFVLFTLGPILWSAFSASWRVLHALDPGLGLDLLERIAFIKAAELAATPTLEHAHLASSVGAVCAGLGSAFLLWRTSPARARAKILGRPAVARPTRQGAAAAFLLVGAGALLVLAQPMKRENETPWPPGHALGLDWRKLQTPEIDGPDELERGPVIEMTSAGQSIDGGTGDARGIGDRLVTYRNNFALLHPGEPFRPQVLLVCSPDVSSDRIFEILWEVFRSDIARVSFVFQTTESLARPVLGAISWTKLTAANVWVTADAALLGATVFSPDQPSDCGAMAARIVALRRVGQQVVLVAPSSWFASDRG